ncbi:response regulator [candidate division KSB1 bacterium]
MTARKNTVLIADCDEGFRNDMNEKFSDEGYRVFLADSGKDAVSCVMKREVNLAIINVDLEDIEGYKIIPMLKDINKDIKVIMTTAANSIERESKCRAAGIIFYALKPVDYTQVLSIMKCALQSVRISEVQ